MAVTAKRDNLRLIAIVLGENEGKVRNNETMELLNYGFDNYKIDLVKSKDEIVETVKIDKGNKKSVDIYLKNDLAILSKKSDKNIKYDYEVVLNDIKIPLKNGDVVGKINLLNNNKVVKSEDLIVKDDINKVNYFKYIGDKILNIF